MTPSRCKHGHIARKPVGQLLHVCGNGSGIDKSQQHRGYISLANLCAFGHDLRHFGHNSTSQVLFEYQAIVYRMVRSVIGDHAFLTHRTHQMAFQHFRIASPLDMLRNLAMGLTRRLTRRDSLLQPNDFLHSQHWTHLNDILQLIHCVQANS